MRKYLLYPTLLIFCLYLFNSCTGTTDARWIINKTIATHGGEQYENSRISFTFRGIDYVAEHQDGRYMYRREMEDSAGEITDRLTNDGFRRWVNGERVELTPEDSSSYANSVNSVIYFALLPYKLNDPAVIMEYLGEVTIHDEPYHEIHVSFKEDGGGKDHEDTFVYWIHREDYTMDYLAYRFHIDGDGTRFRESKNIRRIKDIRFADYNNYKGPHSGTPIRELEEMYMKGDIEKVSEINLENIEVELLRR